MPRILPRSQPRCTAMKSSFTSPPIRTSPKFSPLEPTIDFHQGTLLSQNIFEAARLAGVKRVIYASGSGVFGDNARKIFDENDFSPCPTSTYAASKAAGETLLSAYCSMFGLQGLSYRFANVVGPHQTHGVAFDFIRRLRKNPHALTVMGNGTQTKSYIHVDDIG